MTYKCVLNPLTYPNRACLDEMIDGLFSSLAGEFEVASTEAHKILLIYRGRHSAQCSCLFSWSIDEKYFAEPALAPDLVEIATRFTTMACEDAKVRELPPEIQGWAASGLLRGGAVLVP